jgi:hypothetical protein
MKKYINRYKDTYTFIEDKNHDVLWKGNFEWCRFGMPNDYTRAYNAYCEDMGNLLTMEEFKTAVHRYDDIKGEYILSDKYVRMVDCLRNEIEMVDPSGGPYISRGMSLDSFGFKDYIVKDFKRIKSGYKIITEKCPECHLAGAIHKLSCSTQKMTIFLDQMEKEVHQNNSNLNM